MISPNITHFTHFTSYVMVMQCEFEGYIDLNIYSGISISELYSYVDVYGHVYIISFGGYLILLKFKSRGG